MPVGGLTCPNTRTHMEMGCSSSVGFNRKAVRVTPLPWAISHEFRDLLLQPRQLLLAEAVVRCPLSSGLLLKPTVSTRVVVSHPSSLPEPKGGLKVAFDALSTTMRNVPFAAAALLLMATVDVASAVAGVSTFNDVRNLSSCFGTPF